mgnify:CR=1 FL=1
MKKRLIFIIDSDLYIRNYFKTGFIKKLSKIHDIFFIFSDEVNNKTFIKKNKNFLGYYSFSIFKKRVYYLFNNILLWKFRNRSSSFVFRFYRLLDFHGFPIKIKAKSKLKLKTILIKIYTKFFSINFFFEILKKILNNELFLNKNISNYIKKIKPDLVLYPTNAFEPLVSEIPIICKNYDIKSYFLVDNWDNLSSKSILINQPDYISVWGRQTARHAKKIQGISSKKIFINGTPRYESFFEKRDSKFKNIYGNKKYILFLGTSLKFDEETVVKKIDKILIKNNIFFNNCYLVYRPHPWRQSNDLININELKKTIIDKQVSKNYLKLNFKTIFQPNLEYYPALLSNAEFVLGGLTSMMIEALIFKKKYLAITHNDHKNYTNQYIVSKYFTHFKEIKKIKNILFHNNLSDKSLEDKIKKIWKQRKKINYDSDIDLKYIINNDSEGYFNKINNSIEKIFLNAKS